MKKVLYIAILLLLIGCSNNNHKMMSAESSILRTVKEDVVSISKKDMYAVLINEKLQDYLDKKSLRQQHPEFKDQNQNIDLFQPKGVTEIEAVHFIGYPKIISDSIIQLTTQIQFNNTKTDTIISYIKTSTTTIDGEVFKTSKVEFERIKKP